MRAWTMGSLIVLAGSGLAIAQEAPPEGPPPGSAPRGPLFISPMGEPYRGAADGFAPQEVWFDSADTDKNGALSEDEMIADAARFFAALDQRKDGEIDPDDIERYESVLAPEIRVRGMGGGGRAARWPRRRWPRRRPRGRARGHERRTRRRTRPRHGHEAGRGALRLSR